MFLLDVCDELIRNLKTSWILGMLWAVHLHQSLSSQELAVFQGVHVECQGSVATVATGWGFMFNFRAFSKFLWLALSKEIARRPSSEVTIRTLWPLVVETLGGHQCVVRFRCCATLDPGFQCWIEAISWLPSLILDMELFPCSRIGLRLHHSKFWLRPWNSPKLWCIWILKQISFLSKYDHGLELAPTYITVYMYMYTCIDI